MKLRMLGLLLALALMPALSTQAALLRTDQAVDLATASLLPQGRDEVVIKIWGPLPADTEVRATKESVFVTPASGYAIYIDDHPAANLFHPVRYAFVNAATGELRVYHASSPPLNEAAYTLVETAIGRKLMAVQNRRPPISKNDPPPPTRSDRWAVLMNGGYNSGNNHVRYWNDLSNIYVTLNGTYGFADDHIIVLCSDGLNPAPDQSNGQNSNPDLDGDGDPDIMYSCILSNVDLVFGQLATILTADDKLFVFTTDHGSTAGGWSTIQNLWNQEELADAHFAALLDALPDCEIICTLEPCYSGGFLDNVVVPPGPRVGSSACAYNQLSYAMSNLVYDEYVFHWTAAVEGHDAYGNPADADYNGDGIITMDEAFRYAESHDQASEDPQYDDEPNGCGAGISFWPTGAGPFLVVSNQVIDDLGGNNNGAPDPGETISMILTLTNVGSGTASNIVGTLSTSNQFLTVTQSVANFPNLAHFEQGQGTPAYQLIIDDGCPQGQTVTCNLHITADSAYTNDVIVSFIVGDILYDPIGPDAYGYYAYDQLDQPEGPEFSWIEIAPGAGGAGTLVSDLMGQDDRSTVVNLPFTFRYYGQNYSQVTICTNGWLAMGSVSNDSDWSNSQIPGADGPPAMIAPFWEDMNLETGGQIATHYNVTEGIFVVEYYRVPQYQPATALETFEVILRDPAAYPTSTGDGQILIQYNLVSDPSSCTLGIENDLETIGLQYLFDGTYNIHAAPLQAQSAVLYTTPTNLPNITVALTPYGTPIQIPASGGRFNYNIAIGNDGMSAANFDVWCDITLPDGSSTQPVLGPVNLTLPPQVTIDRDRTQNVPGSAPAGNYVFHGYVGDYPGTVWSEDEFPFSKLATGFGYLVPGWLNYGEDLTPIPSNRVGGVEECELISISPNPFNPLTAFRFSLPQAGPVKLAVFDVSGRLVAQLIDGWREAGTNEAVFDGSHLSAGVYLYRLTAGDSQTSGKLLLLK